MPATTQDALLEQTHGVHSLGKGKAPLGKGKGHGPKRHSARTKLTGNLEGISKRDIKRTARRGGVKRMTSDTPIAMRQCLHRFLNELVRTTYTYTEYAHRKTISELDVMMGCKKMNITLYGTKVIGTKVDRVKAKPQAAIEPAPSSTAAVTPAE